MSRLSVYWPDEIDSAAVGADEPMILPFPVSRRLSAHVDAAPMDVSTRARVLFANRHCEDCGYPVVEPIELGDSIRNFFGLVFFGFFSFFGFFCFGFFFVWFVLF